MAGANPSRARDRRLPRWLWYGVLGIAISWPVALVDWTLVEAGVLPHRDGPSLSLGAVDEIAIAVHRSGHPTPPNAYDTRYVATAYGFPFRGWGTVIAQPWISGGQARSGSIIAVDVSGVWPSQTGFYGCFDRFLPVCPFLLPLIFNAAFWGLALWGGTVLRRRLRRGGETLCEECGYSLAGLPAGSICPECGEYQGPS